MDYNKLIETVSEIFNNDLIYKEGMFITYELDEITHRKFSEHLFYKMEINENEEFEYSEEYEVELGGIIIKFVKNEK